MTDKPAFGNATFRIPVDLKGKNGFFAAWDSAVNGAFTMPGLCALIQILEASVTLQLRDPSVWFPLGERIG